jgi:hypothetical protein
MASIEAEYKSKWISRDEAIVICEAHGLGLGPGGRLLERLKQDQWPPVSADKADPASDLFRINPRAFFGDGVVGFSERPGALRKLYEFGRGWESMQISRELLKAELDKIKQPKTKERKRGRKPKVSHLKIRAYARRCMRSPTNTVWTRTKMAEHLMTEFPIERATAFRIIRPIKFKRDGELS